MAKQSMRKGGGEGGFTLQAMEVVTSGEAVAGGGTDFGRR